MTYIIPAIFFKNSTNEERKRYFDLNIFIKYENFSIDHTFKKHRRKKV